MNSDRLKENGGIDYVRVFFSWWWLIVLISLACGIVGVGYSCLQPNVYEASALLIITSPQFKTTLNPGTFPAETYKRILESKGLLSQVLEKMRKKYPKKFDKVTVEDVLASCRVDLELAGGKETSAESSLLVLSVRHTDPVYAMEISNIWAKEFIALIKGLQKARTGETERFVSEQFEDAEKKLTQMEKAVTDFRDTAQIEALSQQIATVSKQANALFGQLESRREELALERRKLATLEERIGAVEVNGKWLCELSEGKVDLSGMNSFQKGIASELLKFAKLYQGSTERLAALAETADVETLRKRLSSYRKMLVEKNPRLETVQAKRKSLEAALNALSHQLDATRIVIALKKSLPDEVLWGQLLDRPSKKDIKELSRMHLTTEILNPDYVQLTKQINVLREELEKAMSEEKHITAKIPQMEEEVKKFESKLRIQEKKRTDLETCYREAKKAYEARYVNYMRWLDEKNEHRIKIAGLEHIMTLLEERHNKRLVQMRSLGTNLNKEQDKLKQFKRGVGVANHTYELLKNKVEEARIVTAQETEDIRLVSSAIKPGKKVAPQRSLTAIVATVIGFLLSLLVVGLLEYRAQLAK